MDILPAREVKHWATARMLIQEYVDWLNIDLSYQNYDAEFRNLEQMYSPPSGLLLLAEENDQAAGCIAFREKGAERCEMKRLYVRPAYRSRQLGRTLVEACIKGAQQQGYKEMVLDTLPMMKGAIHLYQQLGFRLIPPYYDNPVPEVIYLGLDL